MFPSWKGDEQVHSLIDMHQMHHIHSIRHTSIMIALVPNEVLPVFRPVLAHSSSPTRLASLRSQFTSSPSRACSSGDRVRNRNESSVSKFADRAFRFVDPNSVIDGPAEEDLSSWGEIHIPARQESGLNTVTPNIAIKLRGTFCVIRPPFTLPFTQLDTTSGSIFISPISTCLHDAIPKSLL